MASRNANFHQGTVTHALLSPLRWAGDLFLLLTGFLIARCVVDWIFVSYVWPDGVASLESMLGRELCVIANIRSWHDLIRHVPVGSANQLYRALFEWTGIHKMALTFADPQSMSVPDSMVRQFFVHHHVAIQASMLSSQILGLRLGELCLLMPLAFLAYGVGTADGLAMRCVRKSRGGLESSNLYHRAKYVQIGLCCIAVTLVLLLPLTLDVRFVAIPLSPFLLLLAHLQWRFYKKHL
jgi:hypothetical protein